MTSYDLSATPNQSAPELEKTTLPAFRNTLEFNPKNGTIIINLDRAQLAQDGADFELEGTVFTQKSELHLTLCNFQLGKEIKSLLADPQKKSQFEALIEKYAQPGSFQVALPEDKPLLRIEKDVQISEAGGRSRLEHRESIVREVRCPEADKFLQELSSLLNHNLPAPFLHVTLFTSGSTTGIGINTRNDLQGLKAREVTPESIKGNSFHQIDGVRVYNRVVGTADAQGIGRIEATPEVELHLLRHFTEVSEEYKGSLIGKSYQQNYPEVKEVIISEDMIESALATRGSKFFANQPQIANPKDLIEMVREEALRLSASPDGLRLFDGGFCQKSIFTLHFPVPIGINSLVPIVPGEKYVEVVRGKLHGDAFLVKTLPGGAGEVTEKMNVIIGFINGEATIFSAHPGELAPPFPADGQPAAERIAAQQFWNTHTLVS